VEKKRLGVVNKKTLEKVKETLMIVLNLKQKSL